MSFTFSPDATTADLSVAVTDSNVVFTEGTNGAYTVTVSNGGTTPTTPDVPVQVRDVLPNGFSFVSGGGNGWSCSGASIVVTCSLGTTTIANGANSQFTITTLPGTPAAANSPVQNFVQVFGGGDVTSNNNLAFDTTNVNPAPAPVVDIAPPSKDFGSAGAGTTSATQTFTLLNSGNGTLNVTSITKGGTDAAEFNLIMAPTGGFTCPAGANILAASASCTFGVSFSPTGGGTTRSANISVTSNASTSPNLVPLTGTNVPLGTLTGSATSFNFGSVVVGQSSATQTFTLSNTGPGDLTVSALDVVGNAANSDDFNPDPATTCPVNTEPFVPFPLASGGSCIIVIPFTPTALGLRELTATFTATNSTVASVAVTLSGTGLAGAATGILTTSSTTAVQSAAINTAFPTPLQVRVTDASGFPVAGVLVTFTAPGAGASGTFAGGVNTATTDVGGVATAAAFTANGITGNYTVSASAGAVGPITFNMNNLANTPSIQTIAGGGSGAAPSICADSQFGGIFGGFYYFRSCNQVFKAPVGGGDWTLVAGTGAIGYSGDEGLAINATLGNGLGQIFVDTAGNVFIADAANNRVRRVDAATGIIQTIAGFGTAPTLPAPNDDGTPAVLTQLSGPRGVFVDGSGVVFIADTGTGRVRKIVNGEIQTVAGNGSPGFSGDTFPATSAQLDSPLGLFVDGAGNVFIVDSGNGRIRKVDTGGTITTLAGGGANVVDGVVPTATRLDPQGVWVDGSGDVYITDISFSLVRKISGGLINSIAGSGFAGYSGDGGAATAARTLIPLDVYVDGSGNVFFSSHNGIRRIDGGTAIISTVVGNSAYGFSGNGGAATSAQMYEPGGVARDQFGNIYIADTGNFVIRKVNGLTGIITTVAGNGTPGFSGDGGSATAAQIEPYSGVAVDASGNIFFIDRPVTSVPTSCRVREVVAATGNIQTVAGNGSCTGGLDGVAATATSLQSPNAVATDAAGNLFIAQSSRVRVVNMQVVQITVNNVTIDPGQIATVAGTTPGFSGDGLQATAAQLRVPRGLTIDGAGNLFIADTGNGRIRKVDTAGVISTVAGTGTSGYNGDGIPATSANISAGGVALDAAGNIFIVDRAGARIREVLAASGQITTIAFNGLRSFSGDGGPAVNATSNIPVALALDAATNLLIADNLNARIRYAGATNPAPTITQLVPSTKPGGVGFTLTVNGTNFVPNSFVTFNGVPKATIYVSDIQVMAQISATDVASEGTVQVTVSNPIPGGGTSANTAFNVTGAVNTFTNGGGDGLWTNDNNWDLAHKPTSTETAVIPTGFSVTLDNGAQTVTAIDMQGTATLTISAGSLTFSSASTATNLTINGGTLTANAGLSVTTALNVTAGTAILGASSSATDVTINGGTLTANAALAISGALNLSPGGTINGTGNVTISSPLTWTGGTMTGTGQFTNSGTANITGGTLDGKTFMNSGGGNAHVSNLTMSNGAIFENTFPAAIDADTDGNGFVQGPGATSVINNRGTFIRFTATGNYVIDGVQFNNYRSVIMQTDSLHVINGPAGQFSTFGPQGNTMVNSGDIAVDSPLHLSSGIVSGTHTLFGGLDNINGTTRPGNATTGILTVDTSYTQHTGGTLDIELGGTTVGTQYDQLNVTGAPGTAALDGTLNVTLINGFLPILGDSFTIVQSAGALTGTFSTVNTTGAALGVGLSWRTTYNTNSVVLDVVAGQVTFSPSPKDFSNVIVGQQSTITDIQVTNSGGATLNIASITLTGTDAGQFAVVAPSSGTQCVAGPLAAGASCNIGTQFAPTSTGLKNAQISIADDAPGSPHSVALTGTGIVQGTLTIDRTSFDYGNQVVGTSSASQTFTLSNTGPGDLTVSALDVTGNAANSDDFNPDSVLTTCPVNTDPAFVPFPLTSGSSCNIVIAFKPTALGLRQIVVTFTTTNSTVNSVVATLSGTGIGGNNTYTNANNTGLWQDDLNWSLGHAPNSQDTAIIDGVAPNSASVILSNGLSNTILALNMTSAGTLTINNDSTLISSAASSATSVSIGTGAPSGFLTANNTLNVTGTLTVASGGINGTGNVTSGGTLSMSGGTIEGSGVFTNNGTVNITGGQIGGAVAGKVFNNTGTANVANLSLNNGAQFNSIGTINGTANGSGFKVGATTPGTLNNNVGGTITVSPGGGNSYMVSGITLNNSGNINVTSGTLQLSNSTTPVASVIFTQTIGTTSVQSGASIATEATLTIAGGALGGAGTVTPSGAGGGVNNTGGIVAPGLSPAVFNVSPTYAQGVGGALNIELGGTTLGTQYDELNVSGVGTATLDGTLNVSLRSTVSIPRSATASPSCKPVRERSRARLRT